MPLEAFYAFLDSVVQWVNSTFTQDFILEWTSRVIFWLLTGLAE